MKEIKYKVIIVGSSGVGKTNICMRFFKNTFDYNAYSTICVDFVSKMWKTPDGSSVKINLWDTAGQESYLTVTRQYYRDSHGAIVVYDVSNRKTFERLEFWLQELKMYANYENMTIMVMGNKNDLAREVSEEEGKEFAQSHRFLFCETSALNCKDISVYFEPFLTAIHNNVRTGSTQAPESSSRLEVQTVSSTVDLNRKKSESQEESKCPC